MTRFVIDAFAWIEYFDGSERGLKAKNIIENKENDIYTSYVTFAEVVSKFLRKGSDTEGMILAVSALSKIPEINKFTSIQAGSIHAEMKKKTKDFGLADAFVIAAARDIDAKILTGDPHFKNIKEAMMI